MLCNTVISRNITSYKYIMSFMYITPYITSTSRTQIISAIIINQLQTHQRKYSAADTPAKNILLSSNINSKFYFCMSLISISLSIYMVNLLSIRNRCSWLGRLPLRKAWAVVGLHLPPNTSECIIVAAAAVTAVRSKCTLPRDCGWVGERGWVE